MVKRIQSGGSKSRRRHHDELLEVMKFLFLPTKCHREALEAHFCRPAAASSRCVSHRPAASGAAANCNSCPFCTGANDILAVNRNKLSRYLRFVFREGCAAPAKVVETLWSEDAAGVWKPARKLKEHCQHLFLQLVAAEILDFRVRKVQEERLVVEVFLKFSEVGDSPVENVMLDEHWVGINTGWSRVAVENV